MAPVDQPEPSDGRSDWLVTWGRLGRWDWRTEVVRAFDPDEALVEAGLRHPELPRPSGVFPARPSPPRKGAGPDRSG